MTAITKKLLLRHKGRSGGDVEPFSMVPVDVLKSDACRTLPHPAHRVLVSLAAQYHGKNNGSLSLTRRTAAEFGIGNAHVLGASMRELEKRGLIRVTRHGTRTPPLSAFYAVTWRAIDKPNPRDPHEASSTVYPTDDWRAWSTTEKVPHWTVNRRFSMWRRATSAGGAGPQGKSKMGGAGPLKDPIYSVAQGHCSHILGVGGT